MKEHTKVRFNWAERNSDTTVLVWN